MTSNTEVSIEKWSRHTVGKRFHIDDDRDDYGHLDSESEEEEDEGVSAYLASSNSAWRGWQRLAKLFLLSL